MFRKFVLLLSLCSAAVLHGGTDFSAGSFRVDPEGTVRFDKIDFKLKQAGSSWDWCSVDAKNFKESSFQKSKNTCSIRGIWHVRGGKFAVKENVIVPSNGKLDLALDFTAAGRAVPCNMLGMTVSLSHNDLIRRGLVVNGKSFRYPVKCDKNKAWLFTKRGKNTILIPLENGSLKIITNAALTIQDNRVFGKPEWEIRFRSEQTKNAIAKEDFRISFEYIPSVMIPVDLSRSVNVGFADNTAGDGKGGWTDQGPDNDLRKMPVGKKIYAGIPFDVIDPAKNNGKSCIGMWFPGHVPNYLRSVQIACKDQPAGVLYLLHSVAWQPKDISKAGEIEVVYADGRKERIPVSTGIDVANWWSPKECSNAIVGWTGRNEQSKYGVHVSQFILKGGKVRSIRFTATGKTLWMIVAATLGNVPQGIPFLPNKPVWIKAGKEYQVLNGTGDVIPGSILDLSYLLEAPAGKYGFVRKGKNGHFEFEKRPGIPVRFFGGNLCNSANYLSKLSVKRLLDVCTATGYNLLRLHHYDGWLVERSGKTSTTLLKDKLDQLDYLFSEAKKRGVYFTTDLYVSRLPAKGEVQEFPDKTISRQGFKAMIFVSPSARRSWETFSMNLLNHVNPYTGIAWKNDPALITLSLINEDNLSDSVSDETCVAEYYEKLFKEYCRKNKLESSGVMRNRNWVRFLNSVYVKGYREMAAFLRKNGVRQLLTDQNMASSAKQVSDRNEFDLVDNHSYWQHPSFPGKVWRMPMIFGNESAVLSGGQIHHQGPSRIYGKPFTVTEWDWVNPNHTAEGSMLVGACAGLQGWDGLTRFAISHYRQRIDTRSHRIEHLEWIGDPLRQISERAGAMLFLRGDVREAEQKYIVAIPSDYLTRKDSVLEGFPSQIQMLSWVAKIGSVLAPAGKTFAPGNNTLYVFAPDYLKIAPETKRCTYEKIPPFSGLVRRGIVSGKYLDPASETFRSMTGEISLSRNTGIFTVSTPKSTGLILPANTKGKTDFLEVANGNTYAVFFAGSRDGKPLKTSKRILLTHLTDVKNTDDHFAAGDLVRVESWGKLPQLCHANQAEIILNAGSVDKLYACRTDGSRIAEIPLRALGKGKYSFRADTRMGKECVLVYELIRK